MELQVLIVVRKGGKYLLVEDPSSKLLNFPCKLVDSSQAQNDIISTAQTFLDEVLCVSTKLKGVLKISHRLPPPNSILLPSLIAIIVAEEVKSKTDLGAPRVTPHWLTAADVQSLGNGVDHLSNGVISHIEAGVTIHPLELIETICANGVRRISGSLERQMLEESNYGQFELDQIAEEFVSQCGSPSGLMNYNEFRSLILKLGMPESHTRHCFRALSTSGVGLTLQELQLGLCALDPTTPHGAIPGQLRCQFIYRFYNTSGKGLLTFSDFKNMYRDICTQKKTTLSDNEFELLSIENWKHFGVPQTQTVSMNKFLTVVGQLKLRGTSVLFRLPQSPVKRQEDPYTYPNRPSCPSPIPMSLLPPSKTNDVTGEDSEDERMDVSEHTDSGNTEQDDHSQTQKETNVLSLKSTPSITVEGEDYIPPQSSFTIATHSVKVRRSGALSDVHTLWELVGTGAVSGSVEEILEHHKPSFDRLPSINAFDKSSKSNEMLSGLRYFEHALRDDGRGKPKGAFSWGAIDMTSVARCFLNLCSQAVDVCASESRLIEVNSPCYVLGDLHGNFHDLVCFEKVLWRMGPVLTPASFLFLGDYVDRGDFGFEVVAYLLAQKLLMPNKFLLIRGNHEIRDVQQSFTYKTECHEKFGSELGEDVWEATNTVFDRMPVAAVIDKKIFCVHGGIPHPDHGGGYISAINDIPTNLSNPSEDCPLAWEIMWNDPVRQDDENEDESLREELSLNSGFVDNDSRGTAYSFSSKALDSFLKRNDLSHVIRAHEVKEAGFQLQQNGRLLTVFSSSHYCGSTNEAACVLVDNKKIRTIRLDTRS